MRTSRYSLSIAAVLLLMSSGAFAGGQPAAEETSATTAPAAATGRYSEAPQLAELVRQGTLPAVEQRLPLEPEVITPLDRIGRYGGIVQSTYQGPQHNGFFLYFLVETLFRWTPDMQQMVPNIASGWQLSPDARELTIELREGMKWSDGQPFTADDFTFWYNDVALDDELSPVKPGSLIVGGEMGQIERVDDHTVRLSFTAPYSVIVEKLIRLKLHGSVGATAPYAAKHYLSQFHPAYTDRSSIEARMKQEGFDNFQDYWFSIHDVYGNPDLPTLYPWKAEDEVGEPVQRWRRNPYYYKVDSAGNQLPYIDGWDRYLVSTNEAELLNVLSGDTDVLFGSRLGRLQNYPTLIDNSEKGNYDLVPYLWPPNNIGTIFFNFAHQDPVVRDTFLDQRFRIALSVSINRNELSELVSRGLNPVSQPAPPDGPPYFGESTLFKQHTEFDPDRANELLDEMGLTRRDRESYRLRPDGQRLRLQIMYSTGWPTENAKIVEMYQKYWRDLGIETVIKPVDNKLREERWNAADFDIIVAAVMVGGRPVEPVTRVDFMPVDRFNPGREWFRWLDTGGKEGFEPPAGVKRLVEIREQVLNEQDPARRVELTMEAYKLHMDNLWMIGALSDAPESNYLAMDRRISNVRGQGVPIETANALRETWFFAE